MKTTLTLLVLLGSISAFAQTDNAKLPLCNPDPDVESVAPCRLSKKEAGMMVADMMIANLKGLNSIAQKARGVKSGNTDGFEIEDYRVSILKDEPVSSTEKHPRYVTTTQYEVLLNDCRGTDACYGNSLWTVTQVTESDGYTSQNKFKNELIKTELDHLDEEDLQK
jgi:hypothetical protein